MNADDEAILKALADSEQDSMNQSEVYAAVRALARAAVGWKEPDAEPLAPLPPAA